MAETGDRAEGVQSWPCGAKRPPHTVHGFRHSLSRSSGRQAGSQKVRPKLDRPGRADDKASATVGLKPRTAEEVLADAFTFSAPMAISI